MSHIFLSSVKQKTVIQELQHSEEKFGVRLTHLPDIE